MPKKTSVVRGEEKLMPVLNVKKSNNLIHAVGSQTLLSNKIFLFALLNAKLKTSKEVGPSDREHYRVLQKKTGVDFSKGLTAELSNAEIRESIGSSGGSYYQAIRELMDPDSAKSLAKQWAVAIKDEEDGLYGFVNLISATIYDGNAGKMYIKFSDEESIQKQISGLKKSYTLLNFRKMMQLGTTNAFRLYELLQSDIGLKDGTSHKKHERYEFVYGMARLKFLIGYLDGKIDASTRDSIRLATNDNDFERIEEMLLNNGDIDRIMPPSEFIRAIIKKAVKELNKDDQDFIFDFEPVRQGKGGKIKAIRFIITRKNMDRIVDEPVEISNETQLSEDEKFEFIDNMRSLIDEQIALKDMMKIADASGYDFAKIEKAYRIAKQQKEISNLVGFLLAAINQNYSDPVKSSSNRKNSFLDMDKSDIDYDAIARMKMKEKHPNGMDDSEYQLD